MKRVRSSDDDDDDEEVPTKRTVRQLITMPTAAAGTANLFDTLLLDDLIWEIALHLVSPYDYWALARTSQRTWHLLANNFRLRHHMAVKYWTPWRIIIKRYYFTYIQTPGLVLTPELCRAARDMAKHHGIAISDRLCHQGSRYTDLSLIQAYMEGD